jgi:subfamily B ATP-binding cassette protein MsbA
MTVAPTEKARSTQLYRRLVKTYVLQYKNLLFIAGFCMLIVAGTTAANAYLLQPMIDEIFIRKNEMLLYVVPLAFVIVGLLNAVGDFGQMLALKYVGQRVVSDMQTDLFSHLIRSDISLFHEQSSGRLISRMTSDIILMRQSVSQVFTGMIKETTTMLFLGGLMFYQNWKMSLLAIIILLVAVLPITRLGRRMRKVAEATQGQLADFSAQLDGIFQGVRVVKAYGRETYESERSRKTIRQLMKLYYRAARVQSASSPVVALVGTTAMAVILWYSGYNAIHHGTTAGEFTSFIAAMVMAYRPVKALATLNTQMHEGMAAAARFFSIMDLTPTIQDAPDAKPLQIQKGELVFDHTSFTYPGTQGGIHDLNFTVPAGKTVAMVGSSGAGKTTIMNLLLRFYELTGGAIRIDGQEIRDVTLDSLRHTFALVSQDVMLFDDTIRANILYGKLDATEEEIIAAAKKAHAHEFIRQLPQGYDTVVGPNGVKLSGGQRQRVSIARAILKDAPILLLDEATSALDTASERAVQAALEELMQGRTTLVIAHRLSTIQHADTILVLEQGRIIDQGTHAQLLQKSATYQELQQMVAAPEMA